MDKLSLDALKERAESVVTEELMNSISGGTANSCHTTTTTTMPNTGSSLADAIIIFFTW